MYISWQEIDPESSSFLQKKMVKTLEKGKIYAHGNLQGFMDFIKNNRSTHGPLTDLLEKQVREVATK